jgi:hypothetical protein
MPALEDIEPTACASISPMIADRLRRNRPTTKKKD